MEADSWTERIDAIRCLLLELGRDGNNPTEAELVLGCRDGARALADALGEVRRLRAEIERRIRNVQPE